MAIAVWSQEPLLLTLASVHEGELTLFGSPDVNWSSE
jgi:hypothetical protein